MNNFEEIKNKNATKIKIFSSGYKNPQLLEDDVNSWLFENSDIHIINIITTSNSATVGSDTFYNDELFLIVIYK